MARSAVKIFAVLASSAVAAGALALACSPFGTAIGDGTPGADGGPDGGALLEGGTPEGSAIADASASDVGRPCLAPSCVDFESGVWPASWAPHPGNGSLTVTSGPTTSGGFALDVVFTNQPSFLSISVAGAKRVRVTANVRVMAFGEGEVDVLGIAASPNSGATGLYLVHPKDNAARLAAELPNGGGQTDVTADFTAFVSVTLELDLTARSYAYTVGSESMAGQITGALTASTLAVLIGGVYPATGKAWHLRYDDVEIVTQ